MLTLYLVRHGETEANRSGRLQGHWDTPLTELGKKQAALTAKALSDVVFDAVYSSDLGRARSTAEEIMKGRTCPLILDRRLREINLGVFQGHTDLECQELWPEEYRAFLRDRINYRRPGGESYQDVGRRLEIALSDIVRWNDGGHDRTVAIVSHGGVVNAVLSLLCDLVPGRDVVGNCSISVLTLDKGKWAAGKIGDACHLQSE